MEQELKKTNMRKIHIDISYCNTKNITVEVKRGKIYCRAPRYMDESRVLKVIEANRSELIKLLDSYKPHAVLEDGGYVDLFGECYKVVLKKEMGSSCIIKDQHVYASNKKNIEDHLRKLLLKEIDEMVDYFIKKGLKVEKPKIQIRKMISRYGSCTPATQTIRFSYYLIHYNKEQIASVVAHELCHLLHPNHQMEFYDELFAFFPNYVEVMLSMKEGGLHE